LLKRGEIVDSTLEKMFNLKDAYSETFYFTIYNYDVAGEKYLNTSAFKGVFELMLNYRMQYVSITE
jgi:hypothetical protein